MNASPDRRPIAARQLRVSARTADWLVRRGASANAISLLGMTDVARACEAAVRALAVEHGADGLQPKADPP